MDKNVNLVLSKYKFIKDKKLECMYPNLEIIMRMYLSTAGAKCSGERVFFGVQKSKILNEITIKDDKTKCPLTFYY